MRKVTLAQGEIYHIFNRGVDKRIIFSDEKDVERFLESMKIFNTREPVGSLYEQSFQKERLENKDPLVHFIAYCLLPNHFHFILQQVTENGISQYMKRLLGGYTWYFNNKYKRTGSLFQGAFKSVHVDSNEYLLHLSAYVNLNNKQKEILGDRTAKLIEPRSSWKEYLFPNKSEEICLNKNMILDQFNSSTDYEKFALSSLEDIKINKEKYSLLE